MAAKGNKSVAGARTAPASPGLVLGVYGVAIFLSAGLLFAVQPLFAKIVLPALGGAPSVWSVALVFFQAALLGGYLYAHLLTLYLPGRQSVIIHLLVMLAATLALPLGIAGGWGRPPTQGAEFWLMGLFTVSIGLPFFAISANAPLLQAWFARTGHPSAKDPYFLYAASNVGSFLALLSYPFLVEPFTRLGEQTSIWSGLFFLLIALIAACGVLLVRSRNVLPLAGKANAQEQAAPTWRDAARWVALAAVPSAFLIAVTAHISTDIAAAPLLWVVPLALYLLTYVIVFQTKRIIPHELFVSIQPALIALLVALLIFSQLRDIFAIVAINIAAFFVTAMVCHGELALRRPAARHLTEFYLWVAVGGVTGGIFAGLIAPHIFNWIVEYPLLIVAGLLCRPGLVFPKDERGWLPIVAVLLFVMLAVISIRILGVWPEATAFNGMIAIALFVAVIFLAKDTLRLAGVFGCVLVLIYAYLGEGTNVRTVRSFFGVHKIFETSAGDLSVRVLMHGTTIHGGQLISGARLSDGRPATVTYFGPKSPMSLAFEATKENKGGPIRVGVVGLGTGTVACFVRPEDALHFYEIDQAVVRIALDPRNFEFVASCKPDSRIIVGDARLTLADAPDGQYDLIVMDAFTSDAVPVHLLTREAMALYLKKLAPGGMIVSHVMNRHLELSSVVAGIAAANGLVTRVMYAGEYDSERYLFGSSVAAVARSEKDFGAMLESGNWKVETPDPEQWVWTDDYSNIVGALIRRMRQ
ncbi:MAG: fused MFS/spermidine synthase [Xanthobacteraceae bacterium]